MTAEHTTPTPPTEQALVIETDRPARRRDRPWWVPSVPAGLGAAALLGLMTWQVLVRGPFIAWDWDVHVYVDARQPEGLVRSLLDALASLGGQRLYTLPIIATVGLYVAYRQRRLRPLIAIAAGLATVLFVGYWIKFGLGRTPPASGQDVLHGVGQAFPSGHTANATLTWFLLVVVLFGAQGLKPDPVRFRRYLWLALAGVIVTGGLMTTLDYHWLSDIPGGWVLGLLALMVSVTVLRAPAVWPFRPVGDRGRGWPSRHD
ncbi:phosphatase PAP2 family protein [Jiangella asiatica]|uniref:Phosphatase PAP2 family protein n=1 Tax=Jiangella asiatica TaxID=2530372 RepID=A0A4R5D9Y3_9ACTN|nr:phosphatase PAP2 family protein [Jiangella asiatica]TDE10422.1 phosphatase PAP2 family protein [Jiangella asiatica]